MSNIDIGNSTVAAQDNSKFTASLLQWGTQTELPGEYDTISSGFLGLVSYPTFANRVRRIDFYIPEGMKITKVELRSKYFDKIWTGGSTTRLNDIYIRLNPTKNTIDQSGSNSWQYTDGTVIRSAFSPSVDEEEVEDIFTRSQIEDIDNGWNRIVFQQETEDVSETNLGHIVGSLLVYGFLSLS